VDAGRKEGEGARTSTRGLLIAKVIVILPWLSPSIICSRASFSAFSRVIA
jgi:hypothetical protein